MGPHEARQAPRGPSRPRCRAPTGPAQGPPSYKIAHSALLLLLLLLLPRSRRAKSANIIALLASCVICALVGAPKAAGTKDFRRASGTLACSTLLLSSDVGHLGGFRLANPVNLFAPLSIFRVFACETSQLQIPQSTIPEPSNILDKFGVRSERPS